MRTIAISDVHGCYNELKDLISSLETSGKYNKNTDKLVFLGDYVDRGEDSRRVIKFIRDLQKDNNNVIALLGNHEDMLLNDYDGINDCWEFNFYKTTTIKSYYGYFDQFKDDLEWMKSLPLYHEDEHFIYVHAGVDIDKPMNEQNRNTLLWIREPFIFNAKEYYKQVVFGHTPTIMIDGIYHPILTYNNNIAIDTGCVFGGALSALIIDDDKVTEFCQIYKEEEEYNSMKNA